MNIIIKRLLIAGIPLYLALFAIVGVGASELGIPDSIDEIAEGIWQSTLLVFWYVLPLSTLFKALGLVSCGEELGCLPNSGGVLGLGFVLSLILYLLITIFSKRKKAAP